MAWQWKKNSILGFSHLNPSSHFRSQQLLWKSSSIKVPFSSNRNCYCDPLFQQPQLLLWSPFSVDVIYINLYTWVFPKIGVPQNEWFIMENPIKMDDLGVPLFLETSIYFCGSTTQTKKGRGAKELPKPPPGNFWALSQWLVRYPRGDLTLNPWP